MPTNLIIDGHGTDLTNSFNFQRSQGNECTLYSYVRTGISVPVNQSDNIIYKIINNNYSSEITIKNSSRIGGGALVDRLLGAIQIKSGVAEWDNDALFSGGVTTNLIINGVSAVQIASGNNLYFRLTKGVAGTVKLSDILNHYNIGQYNVFWCVCR